MGSQRGFVEFSGIFYHSSPLILQMVYLSTYELTVADFFSYSKVEYVTKS